MADVEAQIAAIKARKEKLNARLAQLAGKAKSEQRKRDTRRKIIVGGVVLAAVEKDPAARNTLRKLLATAVTREKDRELLADLLGPTMGHKP